MLASSRSHREGDFEDAASGPRGERPQPAISSGSLHMRSHIAPSCGTSENPLERKKKKSESLIAFDPPKKMLKRKNDRNLIPPLTSKTCSDAASGF